MKISITLLMMIINLHYAWSQEKILDIHVHIWDGENSVKTYLAQLDSTGQHVSKFGGIHMARKGKLDETRKKNDELISLSKRYSQLLPICSVHPMDGQAAIQELERLAANGVSIIKLHPHQNSQNFDVTSEKVLQLCRKAGELGIAILMDNANIIPGDSENLFNLAINCPKTNFIFAHIGGLNFRFWNILTLARTADGLLGNNIYFDISATLILIADSPLEDEFIWTLRNVGTDNLLLGSDFPQFSLQQATEALERLNLTVSEKNKIRYENGRKLFSLED